MRRHTENTCQITAVTVATVLGAFFIGGLGVLMAWTAPIIRVFEPFLIVLWIVILIGPGAFWFWVYDKVYRRMRRDEG